MAAGYDERPREREALSRGGLTARALSFSVFVEFSPGSWTRVWWAGLHSSTQADSAVTGQSINEIKVLSLRVDGQTNLEEV